MAIVIDYNDMGAPRTLPETYWFRLKWLQYSLLFLSPGQRPFKCSYCPYSASQKGNLKTHVLCVHRVPFDNSQYPDRRFKRSRPESDVLEKNPDDAVGGVTSNQPMAGTNGSHGSNIASFAGEATFHHQEWSWLITSRREMWVCVGQCIIWNAIDLYHQTSTPWFTWILVTVRLISDRPVLKTLTKQRQDNEINKSAWRQRCDRSHFLRYKHKVNILHVCY